MRKLFTERTLDGRPMRPWYHRGVLSSCDCTAMHCKCIQRMIKLEGGLGGPLNNPPLTDREVFWLKGEPYYD